MKISYFLGSFVLLGAVLNPGIEGESLLGPRSRSRKSHDCCKGDGIVSCLETTLDTSALGKDDLYLKPLNATLKFEGMLDDSNDCFQYRNDNANFLVTLDRKTGGVQGNVNLDDGRRFVIEYCGRNIHSFKEIDIKQFHLISLNETTSRHKREVSASRSLKTDTTTIVYYSVKVYYTIQFKSVTADIWVVVWQMLNEANRGYELSNIPMRALLHSIVISPINDSEEMLDAFVNMKGTQEEVRGNADVAVLLVNKLIKEGGINLQPGTCGVAYPNTINSSPEPITSFVIAKCGTTYEVFGHELGHVIGLRHHREFFTNQNIAVPKTQFKGGYGLWVEKEEPAKIGLASIMAYQDSNHMLVNVYSGPNVKLSYQGRSVTFGKTDYADSVKVLTEERFKLAAIGDESLDWDKCVANNNRIVFKYYSYNNMNAWQCRHYCQRDNSCVAWSMNFHNGQWWFYYTRPCIFIRKVRTNNIYYASGPEPKCVEKKGSCLNYYAKAYISEKFPKTQPSASDCHKACSASRNCVVWTYEKKTKACRLQEIGNRSSYSYSGSGLC